MQMSHLTQVSTDLTVLNQTGLAECNRRHQHGRRSSPRGSEISSLKKTKNKEAKQTYLGGQLGWPCRIMSRNPNAPLELAAADRSRTECLMRHFAALQESPLPDYGYENPDRGCRSERSAA